MLEFGSSACQHYGCYKCHLKRQGEQRASVIAYQVLIQPLRSVKSKWFIKGRDIIIMTVSCTRTTESRVCTYSNRETEALGHSLSPTHTHTPTFKGNTCNDIHKAEYN